ncbi:MAG TPA: DUF3592 domain-containing protein [Oculatellaceae cyanobacterium]
MLAFIKTHSRQLNIAVMLLPSLIGLGMLICDFLEMQEGIQSLSWTEAKGKILNNSVRSDRVNNRMVYIPTIVYSYHVADEPRRGRRISYPDGLPATEKNLHKLLESVAVEHPITAYYDPKNVSHVTLVRGIRKAKYLNLFLRDGAIVLCIPALLLLQALVRKRQKQPI